MRDPIRLLNDEPGGDVVQEALAGAVMGAVNLSEVMAKLMETRDHVERCQSRKTSGGMLRLRQAGFK